MNLGKMIAEKRKERGMTQQMLAERLNISFQAISKWENGYGYPDVTLLPKLAAILNVSVDSLFGYPTQSATDYDKRYSGGDFYWGVVPNSLCYDIMRIKPPVKPYRVLDIGCGEGKDAVFLARNGYHVTAFDLSGQGIAKAGELAGACGVHVDFFQADVCDFRLEAEYDIIFSSGVFHYIPEKLRAEVIANLKSHTAKDGIHVINVFVKKPFLPSPPDLEKSEIAAGSWKSGEIFTHYHDWLLERTEEIIFDCRSGGVPHQHCMDVMIAQNI